MPTHSPLPSFHNTPTHSPRSASPTFFGSPPSSAVAEKVALSYQRARAASGGPFRRFGDLFQALRIPLGKAQNGSRRELSVPVLKILHPSRPLPFASSSSTLRGDKYKRSPAIGRIADSRPGLGSLVRVLLALIGTLLFLLVSALSSIKLVGSILRIGRNHNYNLPFTDPSTLVFTPAEIERVWRWEIASGHYPSRRSTPGVSFDVPGGGGGEAAAVAPVVRIENPGLPKRTEEDLRREREVKAEVQRRLRDQAGIGAGVGADSILALDKKDKVEVVPVGPTREYVDIPLKGGRQAQAYPPRPLERAAIDLDAVMDHCDFAESKYVRDCLEVLRINGGLEAPLRRGLHDSWRTTFVPTIGSSASASAPSDRMRDTLERYRGDMSQVLNASSSAFASLVTARQQLTVSTQMNPFMSRKHSPVYTPHPSHPSADPACDPDYPRLFHIFWAGPFTDKPYSAALSFLYTQRLALDSPIGSDPTHEDPSLCRPQLWIWINPGPASSFPDPRAERRMRADLAKNPWSAPLLHSRFKDVVKFRLWNTTEQLDGVSEMKGWRNMRLFNSGGVKYGSAGMAKDAEVAVAKRAESGDGEVADDQDGAVHDQKVAEAERAEKAGEEGGGDMAATAEAALAKARELSANATRSANNASQIAAPLPTKAKDELFERVGSSANKYDRLSVVLSDMARFVLTHRFGGVYLDADTILLRDWTELWNWHGAFAYRWSRLEKYNTAVLKMQRGSAIGHFIFRTAVANGLDFHPMTVSRYTKDANLEGLLLRLPDALFDPAWLNTEYYQRDRPPQPYFKRFEDFFDTPKDIGAAPVATGFDGFFKGAFSYHFHNFWWIPFDPSRNFPDLGPRFQSGERTARGRLLAAKLASQPAGNDATTATGSSGGPSPTKPGETRGLPSPPTQIARREGYKWGDDERDFAELDWSDERVEEDERDLSWAAVLKRTFEAYVRGERPNLYGEWINWDEAGADEY
ncbi:hypothetical protein NBRC10512_002953 [Rhodotorula toruloides]|uniref:RHTO0S20e00408g1_1 n=1 Tax=Rhodotorula toruloides TaxID=5286 RepID=A0A061BL95_RHOTO|nr:RHTO0S20e00408g1_1 [Rhodotorula toruloides]